MIAFQSMLVQAAKGAGMLVPEGVGENPIGYPGFPHFDVFSKIQLCRRMTSPGEHWENAKIIARIPEDKIRDVTLEDLRELGVMGI